MPDPSKSTKEIGHLIIVVSKARHLTNKRSLGKQDPYVTVNYNSENQRTKAIKNAGQRAEWDAEMRYPVIELLDAQQPPDTTGKPIPVAQRKIKGGKSLRLCCYADDSKEPILIGECFVDLTEVFTTGETDEWFQLLYKERFSGEVFLELTYYSSEAPPKKKPKAATLPNANYGGAGSFTSSTSSSSSPGPPDSYATVRPPSGEPYAARGHLQSGFYDQAAPNPVDHLSQGFESMGVSDNRGWGTQYPPPEQYTPRPQMEGYGSLPTEYMPPQHTGYIPHDQGPSFNNQPGFPGYENGASSLAPHASVVSRVGRRPRQSMPVASSGFMPLGSAVGRSPSRNSFAPVPEFDPGLPSSSYATSEYGDRYSTPAPLEHVHEASPSPMHQPQYNSSAYYEQGYGGQRGESPHHSYGGESPHHSYGGQSPYSHGGESPYSYGGESPAHSYGGESPAYSYAGSPNPYAGGASPSHYAQSYAEPTYPNDYGGGSPYHDSGYGSAHMRTPSYPPPVPPPKDGGRRPLPQAPGSSSSFQSSPSHLAIGLGSGGIPYGNGNTGVAFPTADRGYDASPTPSQYGVPQRRYSMNNPEAPPQHQLQQQPQHPPSAAYNAMVLRDRTRQNSLPQQPVFSPQQQHQLGVSRMPMKRPSLPPTPVQGHPQGGCDDPRWFVAPTRG